MKQQKRKRREVEKFKLIFFCLHTNPKIGWAHQQVSGAEIKRHVGERERKKNVFYVRLGDDIVVVSERNIPPRSNRRTGDLWRFSTEYVKLNLLLPVRRRRQIIVWEATWCAITSNTSDSNSSNSRGERWKKNVHAETILFCVLVVEREESLCVCLPKRLD